VFKIVDNKVFEVHFTITGKVCTVAIATEKLEPVGDKFVK
jgi:hypothetical protein